jgi:excinuclease ABC subunit A
MHWKGDSAGGIPGGVLNRLVNAGNTVLVIEHNLDVIETGDWIIDMGPEGGDGGGLVVAEGTPEQVAQVEASYTGKYLRRVLGMG